MRVFLAGASGVIGLRLVPLLVAAGNEVSAMTRTAAKRPLLRELGAHPVVCDVYDAEALRAAVVSFDPDLVMHQLTDLPDTPDRIPEFAARNDRIRTEGTRNLLAAARAAGAHRFMAQSIAWLRPTGGEAVAEHERMVLDAGGLVIRYGRLYGPGTFYPDTPPAQPRIHVDQAARETVRLMDAEPGVAEAVEGP